MSTVRDLITASLLDLGAIASGETPSAQEASDAFRRLNLLLETWRLEGLMAYAIDTLSITLTGAASYTIGPGGAINTTRPVRIGRAAIRTQASPTLDQPMRILTDGEYEDIQSKGLAGTLANSLYYDRANPLGTVYIWPVQAASAGAALYLYVWHPLTAFATLDTAIALPPGYELALQTNLSVELAPAYRDCVVVPPLAAQAVASKALLQRANVPDRYRAVPLAGPSVRTLIAAALIDLGLFQDGTSPTAADLYDGLRRLNLLLETWRLEKLMVYAIDEVSILLTGAASYTIGVGGTINTTRPIALERAAIRTQITPTLDQPLRILSDAEYEDIQSKGLAGTLANCAYYDRANPLGTIYIWPVQAASAGAALYLYVRHPLAAFATLDTAIALPPGYELALQTNLSLELSSSYPGAAVSEALGMQAAQSKQLLQAANLPDRYRAVPVVGTPTVRTLIGAALLDLGLFQDGTSPSAADFYDGLRRLNLLLETWRLERLLVYGLDAVSFATTGAASYTIGPSGDINTTRPVRIERALVRLSTSPSVDLPLQMLTDAEYEGIVVKSLTSSIAESLYSDGAFPLSTLYLWPIPSSGATVYLFLRHPLVAFATLDTAIAFPPGYELALQTNLSLELASSYAGATVGASLLGMAAESKRLIKVGNQQPRFLRLPSGLKRRWPGLQDQGAFLSGGNR